MYSYLKFKVQVSAPLVVVALGDTGNLSGRKSYINMHMVPEEMVCIIIYGYPET